MKNLQFIATVFKNGTEYMCYLQSSANRKPHYTHEDESKSSHELCGGVSSSLSQNNSTAKKLSGKLMRYIGAN